MYDLSIIISGIRTELWLSVATQINKACKKYIYEVIFIGPNSLPKQLSFIENIRYIQDYGCPSRGIQIASSLAEGEILTWLPDDGIINENSLDECIDLLKTKEIKDIICIRYTERPNYDPNPSGFEDAYWTAWYHPALRQPGVDPSWKLAILPMMWTTYFLSMGGLDCRFEHYNINVHDLAFRCQKNGSKIYLSPNFVVHANFINKGPNDPIITACNENDLPLYNELYKDNSRPIKINFTNWKNVPRIWHRKSYITRPKL